MQEKEKQLSEELASIRSILDKAEESSQSGRTRSATTDAGLTEFVFEDAPPARGLVFEQEDGTPAATAAARSTEAAPRTEFDVPHSFVAEEMPTSASHISKEGHAYHVYVPVFTEASENYRMTGRTTPSADKESQGPTRRREEMKCPVVEVVAESGATASPAATAELPEEQMPFAHAEEILVHVEAPPRTDVSTASAPVEEVCTEEQALEEEKETIRRLLGNDAATHVMEDVSAQDELSQSDAPYADEPAVTAEGGIFTSMEARDDVRPTIPDPEAADAAELSSATPARALSSHRARGTKTRERRDTEYQAYSGSTKLKNRFLDSLMALRVRFFAAVVLAAALVFLGVTPLLGIDLLELLRLYDYKGLHAFFDLLLSMCVLLLALPEIARTCKQLFAKQVFFAVLPLASTVGLLAYDLNMIFAGITTYPLFGSLYALGMLGVILAAYLETSAMFSAFKLVSVKGVKHAVERVMTRSLEEENIALDGAIDEYRSYTARMFKTSFVTDFFHRHRSTSRHGELTVFLLGLLFGCSLVIGAIAYFLADGLADGITTMAMTWLAATPVAALLVHPVAYACAQRCCFLEDCAVLGEGTMHEYADVDVISFEDTEVFGRGDVSLKRVLIYGDKSRLPGALRQMASIFMAVGGPLQTLFTDTLDRRPLPASRIRMEEGGISGETEGCTVHAGDASYMTRLGFSIPDSQGQEAVGTTRALYLAEGGVVYAKFIFRYAFSEEFSQLLPIFKEKGIVPLVYTRDPSVTNDLLLALTTGVDCMRVMHVTEPAVADEATPYGSAGMVTLGDKTGAIHLILMAKKYVAYQRAMRPMLLGQVVGGILLFGSLSFLPLSSMLPWMLLWQGAWCALVCLLGAQAFSLRRKRRELIEKEKELSHE